jgi:hypothetical protein
MANNETTFLTPVGRIVQGDLFTAQTTNMEGKPLVNSDGTARVQYFIGLAIAKNDPAWPALWQLICTRAQADFPRGESQLPTFAWKVLDGDAPNNNQKEGFAGHWVLRLTSGFAPQCYSAGGVAKIVDPNAIKRGYYVRAYGSVKGNGNSLKPGMYLNISMVELCGYGAEIVSGPQGDAVFGAAPVAHLPPGASATPMAPMAAMQHPAQGPGGYAPVAPVAPSYPPQGGQGYPQQAPGYNPAPAPMHAPAPTHGPGGGYPPATPGYPPQGGPAPVHVQPVASFLQPPAR